MTYIPYCLVMLLGAGLLISIRSQKGLKNPMTVTTMLVTFLGAIVYYGHLRPIQENLKAEPVKTYKAAPLKTMDTTIDEQPVPDIATDRDKTLAQRQTPTAMEDREVPSNLDSTGTRARRQNAVSNESDVIPLEQENEQHNYISEEVVDETAEIEALFKEIVEIQTEAEASLARGDRMLKEALPQMVHYLNSMSPEEQRITFRQMRIELEKAAQGDDNPELIKQVWQLTLEMFIDGGYTGYSSSELKELQ
jgi:hypothetical protein